jgi:hypothetical protein
MVSASFARCTRPPRAHRNPSGGADALVRGRTPWSGSSHSAPSLPAVILGLDAGTRRNVRIAARCRGVLDFQYAAVACSHRGGSFMPSA